MAAGVWECFATGEGKGEFAILMLLFVSILRHPHRGSPRNRDGRRNSGKMEQRVESSRGRHGNDHDPMAAPSACACTGVNDGGAGCRCDRSAAVTSAGN